MDNKLEELKFVADLAHNGGMMQAQNEALTAEVAKLRTQLNAKDEEIVALKQRNAELEAMGHQSNFQQATMVVKQ